MNLLIIGCAGLLSSNIILLKKKKYKIIGLYNKKKPNISGVNLFKFNLKNLKYINKNYNLDVVINAAGLTNVDFCEKNRRKAMYTHVTILKKTISSLNKNIFFVHISTDHLFNGKKNVLLRGI